MTNTNIKIVVNQDYRDTKSKEEHISDYIDSLKTIEECMEPYKEQKRDLKKEYLDAIQKYKPEYIFDYLL